MAPDSDPLRQREVVTAFLATSRGGDFSALVALLDPGAMLRADVTAVRLGAPEQVRGAADVAGFLYGRFGGARPALINGSAVAVWVVSGSPRVIFSFTVARGTVTAIDLIADPGRLRQLDVVITGPLPGHNPGPGLS